jgi:hypothetical protein
LRRLLRAGRPADRRKGRRRQFRQQLPLHACLSMIIRGMERATLPPFARSKTVIAGPAPPRTWAAG